VVVGLLVAGDPDDELVDAPGDESPEREREDRADEPRDDAEASEALEVAVEVVEVRVEGGTVAALDAAGHGGTPCVG
jgi:hypothetical protein